MKQVVVFCESYPHIKYALYLIVRDYRHCSITVVIPSKHSLFKFFSLVNERLFHNKLDLVYFEVYQRRTTTRISKMKKAIYILPDIIYERKRLREIYSEYFSRFSNAEIYFFSRHFASYSYYLLNKLSGVNRLVFMPDEAWDIISMRRYTPTDIVSLVVLAMMKLTFGWDMVMCRLPYMKGIMSMPDKFIVAKVDKVIGREERNEMMRDFDLGRFKVFDGVDYSVIYFDSILVAVGYIADYDKHKMELTNIFNILGKYFSREQIACKDYPACPGDVSRMGISNVIEGFIPAELLYNDKVKLYISINSCAIANVERGLAVSILNLVFWRDEYIKRQLKEILIRSSKSQILFPESLEEFERIVAGVSGAKRAVADRG